MMRAHVIVCNANNSWNNDNHDESAWVIIRFMRIIMLLLISLMVSSCMIAFSNYRADALENAVFDNAGVLNAQTIRHIDEVNQALEQKHDGAQLIVVTLKTLNGSSIESRSMALAEQYKPGLKGKDNGLVYVISVNDRKDRLEVGYGLEGTIPDAKAADIIALGHSSYKQNDYNAGVIRVINGVNTVMGGGKVAHINRNNSLIGSLIIIILIFGRIIFGPLLAKRTHAAYLASGSVLTEAEWARENHRFSSSGSHSGGSSSFLGGGGSFGGGGASGSW